MGKNAEFANIEGGFWGGCLAAFITVIPFIGAFCVCTAAQKTLEVKDGPGNKGSDIGLILESIFCFLCVNCRTRREQILMGGDKGLTPSDYNKPGGNIAMARVGAPTYGTTVVAPNQAV